MRTLSASGEGRAEAAARALGELLKERLPLIHVSIICLYDKRCAATTQVILRQEVQRNGFAIIRGVLDDERRKTLIAVPSTPLAPPGALRDLSLLKNSGNFEVKKNARSKDRALKPNGARLYKRFLAGGI